jgi:hypothetical protein
MTVTIRLIIFLARPRSLTNQINQYMINADGLKTYVHIII